MVMFKKSIWRAGKPAVALTATQEVLLMDNLSFVMYEHYLGGYQTND